MNIRTVKMLADKSGSPDGVQCRTYFKGKSYDLPESLAKAFVEDLEVAKDVAPAKAEPTADEIAATELQAKQLKAEAEAEEELKKAPAPAPKK